MKLLFVHTSFPGQFVHLAQHFAATGHEVYFISNTTQRRLPGVRNVFWDASPRDMGRIAAHRRHLESFLNQGEAVLHSCQALKKAGFEPEVIIAHSGWGNGLFLRDVFPDARQLILPEFFFEPRTPLEQLINPQPNSQQQSMARRLEDATALVPLVWSDWVLLPTWWQSSRFPAPFQDKISVLHEGIDTKRIQAVGDKRHCAVLPDGTELSSDDEVITFASRSFEPIRGVDSAMQAFEHLLKRHPKVHIVTFGADKGGYERDESGNQTPAHRERWRQQLDLDPARIHFLPSVPYEHYLALLRISSAHLYLTTPFVLSWSMLEAMACGCLVVGSRTAPVEEVIEHGKNGLLVDFDDPLDIARGLEDALERRKPLRELRAAARTTVMERYSLEQVLPLQCALVEDLAAGRCPPPTAQRISRFNPPPQHLLRRWEQQFAAMESLPGPRYNTPS